MSVETRGTRVASVDLVRGAVMILMAIDHVRVYSGIPAGGPTPGVFFTRWITHFCAPAFVFLAGTSAFLYARSHADVSRHLFIRGLWLVFLELTFLRVAWTFNFGLLEYQMAGVLWVIGWCMVLMAALVKLPERILAAVGLVIVAGHNVLDPFLGQRMAELSDSRLSGLWKILYLSFYAGPIQLGGSGTTLMVLYSIVPWIGVMALGFAFGRVLTLPAARRDRICFAVGLGCIAVFLFLRGFNLYGDPRPWSKPSPGGHGLPALLSFLNPTKYPASLSFLLMTLGPVLALLPALERARGGVARAISVFGRVPFFFYLLHVPLIHALALLVSRVRLGVVSPWLFANHPMGNPEPPDGYRWSLPLLYTVWAVAVALLYPACAWFAALKQRRKDRWLSYL